MRGSKYTVSGVSVATTATDDLAIATLWNPSATRRLFVHEAHFFKTTAGAADILKLRRTSTIGTAGTTITPTIVNDFERSLAPPSAATVGVNVFSVAPTMEALDLISAVIPGAIGAGVMWVFQDPIAIPVGAGLAFTTGSALAMPVSRFTWVWSE